ncbi:MAG: VCBS repeat-containing protein [Myxococcaceae bacterium]|nr:VCBS repeat-containing protein [Myxococcaceae bacterium]
MKFTLALGALSVVAAGCHGCDSPPEECEDVLVSFTAPTDGAMVGASADVTLKVQNKSGGTVDLESAKLKTRLVAASDYHAPVDGAINGDSVSFSAVPLEVGANLLTATVLQKGKSCTGTETITVVRTEMSATPKVTAFTFQGDANNDKTLNAMELPGMTQVVAQLAVTDGEGGTVSVKNMSGSGAEVGTGTVENGAANVTLSLPTGMDGSFILFAQVTANGKTNDTTVNPASQVTLTIDRTGPAVSLTSPSKLIQGPADDADMMNTPFQLRTLAMATGDVATIEIAITDGTHQQTTGAVPPSNGAVSRDFDVPAAGTVQYTVTATARDAAGNSATDSKMVTVDFDKPTVDIVSPTAAGGPYMMFTLPLSVNVTGADGQMVSMFTTLNSTRRLLGQLAVANGMATGSANFLPGTQLVEAEVTDAAGNVSSIDSETIVVNPSTGCPLVFTLPSSSPASLGRTADLNAGMPDLQYAFEVASSAACAGKIVTLSVAGSNSTLATGTTDSMGVLRFNVVSLPDSAGQQVTIDAEIDDGAGNKTKVSTIIIVNLSTPAITQPVNNSVLNVGLDLDLATPGVQRALSYSPNLPVGAVAAICSDVQIAGATMGACPDGSGFLLANMVAQAVASFTFPDGVYKLKPVFTIGTSHDTGDYNAFVVDSVRPKVTAVTFMNDTNNDKKLNAAEQATGAPVAVISLMGVPDGRLVTVRKTSDNAVAGTGSSAGGSAAITLSGLMVTNTTEADYALVVETSDGANNTNKTSNPSMADPLNSEAFVTLRVDRVAPAVTLTAPNKAQMGIADDGDVAAAYQLNVSALVPADVGTNGVKIQLGGAATQMVDVTPTGGVASTVFNVSSAGTLAYTVTVTATDSAGNVSTAVVFNVTVDNEAPQVTLVTPNAGGSPYPSFAISTLVNVVGANGLNAVIFAKADANPDAQLDTLPINMAGVASGTVTYPAGTQVVVRAEVTDLAGNKGQSSQTIGVAGMGCSVTLTNPATSPVFLNKSNDAVPATAAVLDYTLTGNSANCFNEAVALYTGPMGSQTLLASTTTDAMGNFSFPLQLAAGTHSLEAQMNVGQPTSDRVDATVDLTDPVVTGVSPSAANLFFVNPNNANLVAPANPAYVADTQTGMADAQYNQVLTVTGAIGGTVSVVYNGVVRAGPQAIAADGQITIPVTLPQGTQGQLAVEVRDQAGNVVTTTANAKVDVLAPGATNPMASLVVGQERTAQLSTSWSGTFDDGASASAGDQPVAYDVRWTTAVVASGGLASSDEFFSGTKAFPQAIVNPPDPLSLTFDVPPLLSNPGLAAAQNLNSYYVYVRARDDVGNYSPFVAGVKVDNTLAATVLSNPGLPDGGATAGLFGIVMSSKGSVNNDNFDDLVVGTDNAVNTGNIAYVYYGSAAGLSSGNRQAISCPSCTANPDGGSPTVAAHVFGGDVSMGNVGDDASGAKSDVLVGARGGSLVYLFFGTGTGATLDLGASNVIKFQGIVGNELGRTAQIIDDINGDGLDEILMAAPRANGDRGNVYLFYGRSIAAWKMLAQPVNVPTTADRVFSGPTTPAQAFLGRNRGGMSTIGQASPDGGFADFSIPASRQRSNKLFIFSSQNVADAGAGTVFTTGTDMANPDQSLQTMAPPTPDSADSILGYGARAVGQYNLFGGAATDLVVGHSAIGNVFVYADRVGALFPSTPTLTIQPRTGCNVVTPSAQCGFGHDIQATDFTGDGRRDLLITEQSVNGSAWLFVQRALSGQEFDLNAGAGFWQSRLLSVTSGFMSNVSSGDFNGDGKRDLVVSDRVDGSGKVFVWQQP